MWEQILDWLRAGCDEGEGVEWAVGIDGTVVRAHQHAAGARREPPKDIPAERLRPVVLSEPVRSAGRTGGRIESHEYADRRAYGRGSGGARAFPRRVDHKDSPAG